MVMKIVAIGLKIGELAVLLAATGFIGYFVNEFHDYIKPDKPNRIDPYDAGALGRYEFFLYTTSVGAIIALVGLVALLTGLHEKSGGAIAMVAVNALWTLQLLVSSALLAKTLITYQEVFGKGISFCDSLDTLDTEYQCSQLTGGMALGFLATAMFATDTVVSFLLNNSVSYS